MAALSSKTQQDNLLLIDTFTLSTEEAQQCLHNKILDMAGGIKDLEQYFVPRRYQRERLYSAIDGDESILKDEEGNMLDDAAVADNILKRSLENKEPLVPLFMNTSVPLLSSSCPAALAVRHNGAAATASAGWDPAQSSSSTATFQRCCRLFQRNSVQVAPSCCER